MGTSTTLRTTLHKNVLVIYTCDYCKVKGATTASIVKKVSVSQRGHVSSESGLFALKSDAYSLGSKKIDDARRDLSFSIENAIKHNVKINAQCPRCRCEQLWSTIINKAVNAKKQIMVLSGLLAVAAFVVGLNVLPWGLAFLSNIGSLIMLYPLVPPFCVIIAAIGLKHVMQNMFMSDVRKLLHEIDGSARPCLMPDSIIQGNTAKTRDDISPPAKNHDSHNHIVSNPTISMTQCPNCGTLQAGREKCIKCEATIGHDLADEGKSKLSFAVKPTFLADGNMSCPICKAQQQLNRKSCYKCGIEFAFD